jgi:formate dehydrogenase major subunit
MAESTCVACGECVQACPTGALSPKTHIGSQKVDRKVDSVCPFCGVGCLITYNVRDEKIISVEGRDGPANHGRLCVKGRFGFDYAHHPDRLTVPLIRKPGVPKEVRPYGADWRDTFREATWDEALDLAAGTLKSCATRTAPRRWRALARPRAATKRPTCSRSWCAPALAATTWTTARGCATRPAWPRCSKAWARAR